jgi:hypothetical protein
MPFCPSCHCEYRPGFTRCSDCDVDLVESLSEEKYQEPDRGELELIEVGTFPDPLQAQMIKELLEDNGIVSLLHSDANAGASPGGIPNTLLVRAAELPKARELFEQYFEGDHPEQDLEQDRDDQDEVDS